MHGKSCSIFIRPLPYWFAGFLCSNGRNLGGISIASVSTITPKFFKHFKAMDFAHYEQ